MLNFSKEKEKKLEKRNNENETRHFEDEVILSVQQNFNCEKLIKVGYFHGCTLNHARNKISFLYKEEKLPSFKGQVKRKFFLIKNNFKKKCRVQFFFFLIS